MRERFIKPAAERGEENEILYCLMGQSEAGKTRLNRCFIQDCLNYELKSVGTLATTILFEEHSDVPYKIPVEKFLELAKGWEDSKINDFLGRYTETEKQEKFVVFKMTARDFGFQEQYVAEIFADPAFWFGKQQGFLIVTDKTKPSSYDLAGKTMAKVVSYFRNANQNLPVFVIAQNKNDLKSMVSEDAVEAVLDKETVADVFNTSAVTGENVCLALNTLIQEIIKRKGMR